MYDIHHFFTPILNKFSEFDSHNWYLYPVATLAAAKELRDSSNLPKNIEYLNASFDRLQKISSDFLTINLHGRKYGRKFILALQERLENLSILDYNNQMRHEILSEIQLTTADFVAHRHFAKKQMIKNAQEFYKNDFTQVPATLVYTENECLHIESYPHVIIQNYLRHIEKTA
ncbi:dithiol-disulfide isomerase [Lactococcus ileimucosae]|uniref:dithiol-disulfide isomerase n=1 Tax=Lactococcus ileimucosae TaxID=2941329 RepID=UPI00204362C9|nr:dithiol-disulfide isomerase [Lactococcus ileimucosae]